LVRAVVLLAYCGKNQKGAISSVSRGTCGASHCLCRDGGGILTEERLEDALHIIAPALLGKESSLAEEGVGSPVGLRKAGRGLLVDTQGEIGFACKSGV
jgi:hypothetical protein